MVSPAPQPPAAAAPGGGESDILTFVRRSSVHHLRIVAGFALLVLALDVGERLPVPAWYYGLLALHWGSAFTKLAIARRTPDLPRAQRWFTALYVVDVLLTTAATWVFGAERWVGVGTLMLSVMMACAALPAIGRMIVTAVAGAAWVAMFWLEHTGVLPYHWLFAGAAPGMGDGRFTAILVGSGVIGIASVTMQLTDVMDLFQRQARRVVDQERRWRALVEVSTHVAWTLGPRGESVEAAPAYLAFTGLTEAETLGAGYLNAVHPEDVDRVRAAHATALRERRPYEVRHRLRRADGAWRETIARVVPIAGPDGRIVEWVGAHTDVTDSIRLDEQLRQAQKMEAVGQLAGGIAHDFNNLLTAINTNLELAVGGLPADHQAREDIAEARAASTRAAELTRQLLDFGRPHALRPRAIALNDVLAGAERLLHRAVGELAFTLALAPEAGAVFADPGQLEQVAMNLVVNARDAAEGTPNGSVVVETGLVRLRDVLWTTLVVRDNGTGMDAETQRRIFEPFFTTKPTGQGSGLGLASVYAIVERAGGEIAVESAPGRGTTMTVRLPHLSAVDGEPVLRETPVHAMPRVREGRILLVEDETPVRRSLRRMLERMGHEVLEARHGADAVVQWEQANGDFDLVLTDVLMPGMGGPELASVLAELQPTLPVLFMSGYTGDALQTRGIPEDALLVKPFTSEALARHIARALS